MQNQLSDRIQVVAEHIDGKPLLDLEKNLIWEFDVVISLEQLIIYESVHSKVVQRLCSLLEDVVLLLI